tara:strand:+ start:50 stop:550 length:501 start_codon:yes stop_codon:yes gene_type:complete
MTKTIFTFFIILLGIHSGFTQNNRIEGKLVPTDSSGYEIIENIEFVFLKLSEKKNRLIEVQSDLSFVIDSIESDSVTLIVPGSLRKSTYNISFSNNETKKIELPISYFCQYDKSINNKTCPICYKTNKVIPTTYGLGFSIKESYNLGCLVTDCEPNWYCKRDEITF